MSQFAVCTNLTNMAGLERDYLLIRGLLESYGHTVHGVMFNQPNSQRSRVDVNIFLEVIADFQVNLAKQNWFIPNSEWYYPCWDRYLPRFNKIICKTKDCYDIWCKKVGAHKCVYTGFEANDFFRPEMPRERIFLHMAGKSETKNTQKVMDAWRIHKIKHPLIAVAFKPSIMAMCKGIPNVTHVERYTDAQVIEQMNRCMFHIMPSKYEGFGHYIHEAIGCGGTVLTTNAPPMNTINGIDRSTLIQVEHEEIRLAAKFYHVSAEQIAHVVNRTAEVSEEWYTENSANARAAFLSDREFFRETFKKVVEG